MRGCGYTNITNIPAGIALLLLMALQCGCTAQYSRELSRETLVATHLSDHYTLKRERNWVLPQHSKIYISYPDVNLLEEGQPITRTQFQLSQQIKIQFTQRFPGCITQSEPESVPQSFKEAQQLNADFLLAPQLIAISDNPYAEGANNNAGRAQKNTKGHWQLNFRLYDARSKKLLDTLRVDGNQGILNWRKQEPAQLFAEGIHKAAGALAGE